MPAGSGSPGAGFGGGGEGTAGTSPTPATDFMPGVNNSPQLGSGGNSSGGSLGDSAFSRAFWGGLGVPASDFVLADTRSTAAAAPPVVVHMSESELAEWVHKALEGTHVIGTVAEVVETFHESVAWPTIEACLAGTAGAGEAGALALLGPVAVPLGYVALIALTFLALREAFQTGTRIEKKMGHCYSLVCGMEESIARASSTFDSRHGRGIT